MITNADIDKFKDVFATKADIDKLKDVFATKEELSELRTDMRVEFGEVHDKIDAIASSVARIENTLDTIAGAIKDQRTENGAGNAHLLRHDRQIEVLARETGITVPN